MTYEQWLATPGLYRCVLVELDYIDAGTLKTAYFSSAAFVSAGTDSPAHTAYDPFVLGGLDFERSLAEIFTGASSSRTADVELVSIPATDWLAAANVAGQAIRIYLGDKAWPKAEFRQVITGVCDSVWPETSSIRIKFKDLAKVLQQPVLTSRHTSGAANGELKPLCLGRCYNISPQLIDAGSHIYMFNSVASQAVTAVRFNGDVVAPADYTVNLAAGTITFSVFPIGDVTMDVDGAKIAGTWLQTSTQIISYLCSRVGITADISGLPGYQLGLYLTDDTQLSAALDDICASVGGYWLFDRLGQFTCRAFNGVPVTQTAAITDDQNLFASRQPRRRIAPLHELTLGYARNWTPLNTIAASIYENTPDVAKRLASEELTVTQSAPAVLAAYADAQTLTVSTLIVSNTDANAEASRRMALSALPRYVYETQQLAAPLQWQLGDGATLQTPGVNGSDAVITKLAENPLKGVVRVEFWQ
ncbi:hypothetical protein [Rheinheimera maricola]|uniref:Uncharacterized protein n=1 Tax=Rheinheimera maricola TaxID=2793282 RepID=A0ABS7X7P0_9GAMM|nr:hypothetical protein [Rheinheimera maricola]MBZ9610812.1 hypothetical protein [Rheinheimera maricola]